MWRRFVVIEIRISNILEIYSYLTFSFLGFKIVQFFKGSKDFGFPNFIRSD